MLIAASVAEKKMQDLFRSCTKLQSPRKADTIRDADSTPDPSQGRLETGPYSVPRLLLPCCLASLWSSPIRLFQRLQAFNICQLSQLTQIDKEKTSCFRPGTSQKPQVGGWMPTGGNGAPVPIKSPRLTFILGSFWLLSR